MATIIFDFDGTIVDSFEYVADFLAKEAGLPKLDDEQKLLLRGLSMVGMARLLGYSWWRMPRLFFKGRRKMRWSVRHMRPFAGMPELIRKLHAEGHELFMVSSNRVRNIHIFLHEQKLHTYFLEVYGSVGMFGKAPALKRLLREQNLDKETAVYIGDELRDVEAAQAIGLRVVAVSWGFARLKTLTDQQPTALAHSPEELLTILEEL